MNRILAIAAILFAVGCSTKFEANEDTSGDASEDPAQDTPLDADQDTPIDVGPETEQDTAPPPCTMEGFVTAFDSAQGGVGTRIDYISDSENSALEIPYDTLRIEMFYGSGDPLPLASPGTYELAASPTERNYSTCHTCVTLWADFDHGVDQYNRVFFQESGQLEITSIGISGDILAGTLRGVRLIEVTVNPDTRESTPVEGGDVWCIEEFSFEQQLKSFSSCTAEGFVTAYDSAQGTVGTRIEYISDSELPGEETYETLKIEMLYESGDPVPLESLGTYVLAATPTEWNYRTCHTCVTLWADFNQSTSEYDRVFFQESGVLEITSIGVLGDTLAGRLLGVRLIEVTVDPDTGASTPVENGDVWCIEDFSFSKALTAFP